MASIKESIRLNTEVKEEARILEFLRDHVYEGKKSAFIKDALTMYIEFIDKGLYNSPYMDSGIEEQEPESRFQYLIDKTKAGDLSERLDSTLPDYPELFEGVFDANNPIG